MPNRRKMAQNCWIFHGMERTVVGVGLAERACVPAFLLPSWVGMKSLRMGLTSHRVGMMSLRMGMTNPRVGMTNPRVGMTAPLSDSSLLLSRQSVQSCDKTTFASIFYCINHHNLCKVLLKSCIFAPEFLQGWAAARQNGRCVIMANLLRYHRIRAWSCTSVHSLRPHPWRLASRPF